MITSFRRLGVPAVSTLVVAAIATAPASVAATPGVQGIIAPIYPSMHCGGVGYNVRIIVNLTGGETFASMRPRGTGKLTVLGHHYTLTPNRSLSRGFPGATQVYYGFNAVRAAAAMLTASLGHIATASYTSESGQMVSLAARVRRGSC